MVMFSLALLILAGCTTTGNVVQETDAATDATLNSLKDMVRSNDDVDVPKENEVSLFITNGGFSPAVVEANAGETIIVTSYYADDVHFSIADLGVQEVLNEADSFRFDVHKKGEYPFICMDCSPMLKGILVVE